MNTIFGRRGSLVLFTAATVLSSAMSVHAEIAQSADAAKSSQSSESVTTSAKSDSSLTPVPKIAPLDVDAAKTPPQTVTNPLSNLQLTKPADAGEVHLTKIGEQPQAKLTDLTSATPPEPNNSSPKLSPTAYKASDDALNNQPLPGKYLTSAAALQPLPSTSSPSTVPEPENSNRVAQSNVESAQYPRSRAYIGVGYNSLGGGGFAVLGKIGITKNISFRPSAAFIDTLGVSLTTIALPVTYDFTSLGGNLNQNGLQFTPYVGIGLATATASVAGFSASDTAFAVNGGVELRFARNFTAVADYNSQFDLTVGAAYNF